MKCPVCDGKGKIDKPEPSKCFICNKVVGATDYVFIQEKNGVAHLDCWEPMGSP